MTARWRVVTASAARAASTRAAYRCASLHLTRHASWLASNGHPVTVLLRIAITAARLGLFPVWSLRSSLPERTVGVNTGLRRLTSLLPRYLLVKSNHNS